MIQKHPRCKNKNRFKPFLAMIFLFMMISLTQIGTISAFDFDNKITYKDKNKTVVIENLFGLEFLGITFGEKLGEAKLKSHSSPEEILNVIEGKNRTVMYYDFSEWKHYPKGLGNVEFIDMKTNKTIEKDYYFATPVYSERIVNIYGEDICNEIITLNSSVGEKCIKNITGTYIKKSIIGWEKIEGTVILDGNSTIGLVTDVKKGDYIDGVWTIAGKKAKRHASWTASLTVGLKACWNFDEGTGNIAYDATGVYNATGTNTPTWTTSGKIGNATVLDYTTRNYWTSTLTNIGHVDLTVSLWSTRERVNENNMLFKIGGNIPEARLGAYYKTATSNLVNFDSVCTVINATGINVWNHLVYVYDSDNDNTIFYLNGVEVSNYPLQITIGAEALTIGKSFSGITQNHDGKIDLMKVWNRTLSPAEVSQDYNNYVGIDCLAKIPPATNITTTLVSPDDNLITNNQTILFNVSSEAANANLINVTLKVYNPSSIYYNNTVSLSGNITTYTSWILNSIPDGIYNWTATTLGTNGTNSTASNRTFTVDTINPNINVTYPIGLINSHTIGNNLSLKWTVSDTNLQDCWFEYNNTNTTVTCGDTNYSFITTSQKDLIFYANDTAGNINSSNTSWNYKILEVNQTYNSSSYYSAKESFILNMSSDGTQTMTANLYYAGIKYSATKTGDNSNMEFTKTFDTPSLGNITHFWSVNYGTENINLSTNYQNVEDIYFSLCNATNTNKYINITFKDEDDLSKINASVPTSNFNYWIGDGTVNKIYTFVNNNYNYEYDFCFSEPQYSIKLDPYMQYKSDGYPQRTYDPSVTTLSNTTTNTTLYLLASADGLYVTFQVVDSGTNTIEGVSVSASRIISGETVIVGRSITGASGSVTFWLNPDFQHTFEFIKDGYTTYTYTDTPTQSSYTISLGTGTTTNAINYYRGMNFRIKPTDDFLTYREDYNFNLTLTSDYWTVEEYGFTLYYDNKSSISSVNDTTNGGILSINNVAVISPSIYMRYYYIINGTTIYSGSARTWTGDNFTEYNYSLTNLFSNIQKDMSEESLLGATDFTRLILSFVLIIMMVGGVGFRFGVKNQAFVGGILWATIFLLDVTLDFMPSLSHGDIIPVNHFPTIIITLIFAGLLVKEVQK